MLSPDRLRSLAPTLGARAGPGGAGFGDTAARQLAVVEAQQAEAIRKLEEQRAPKRVDHNNFKCPRCHRVVHPDASPLILCDTCPRSYHVACLGLAWSELPSSDWCCPKCIDTTQAALRRVMDLEARKKEALERAVNKEKAAEDRLLKRLLAKEERDKRRSDGGTAGTGPKEFVRQPRRVLDDWDVLEEEKEHLARLEIRVKELQELASRAGQGADAGPAAANGTAVPMERVSSGGEALTSSQHGGLSTQQSMALSVDGDDIGARAAEAAEALRRLKLIIQGPPDLPPVLTEASALAALNEATTVAEFLSLYGGACEVHRELNAVELMTAAAWPLDYADDLGQLYSQLLLCCLLEQHNWESPAKGRARRWTRVLMDSTWPEVLRRYLLASRVAAAAPEDDPDDADADDEVDGLGASPSRRAAPALQSAPSLQEPLEGDPLQMDDRQVAVHCATLLGRQPWWELPAGAHLRLLSMLCYDIAQGVTLRNDINARLTDVAKIQTDWGKEVAAARRQQKRAAENAAEGGAKRRRGGKKAAAAAAAAADDDTEEQNGDAAGDDDNETAGMEENEDALAAREAREAEVEAQLAERAFRTDPLGQDRHSRKYWWLRGTPGYIFVESVDGQTTGVISSKAQLDDLKLKLNRRGPREQELHANLRRRYDEIVASFESQPPLAALQLDAIRRPVPTDGRVKQKDLPTLAAGAAAAIMQDCKEKLDSFISEMQEIGVQLGVDLKGLRKEAKACDSPAAMCDYLLHLEAATCAAGEGLPVNGDNAGVVALLGEADAAKLPDIIYPPSLEAEGHADGDGEPAADGAAPMETEDGVAEAQPSTAAGASHMAEANGGAAPAPPPPAAVGEAEGAGVKKEDHGGGGEGAAQVHVETKDVPMDVDTKTEDEGDGATATGTLGDNTETCAPEAPRPVGGNDDLDDSDAEHAYLREKRMRRPARLWRSVRERATWIKAVCVASRAPPSVAAPQVAFAAYLLCDRAGPMLQRFITLAEEAAKWEAEEIERAKQEALRPRPAAAAPEGPAERPMMIRTGKTKTDGESAKLLGHPKGKRMAHISVVYSGK